VRDARLALAVSGGDPAGIGLDITLQAWSERHVLGLPPFAVYTDAKALAERARLLGLTVPIAVLAGMAGASTAFADALPVMDVPAAAPVLAGHPDPRNGASVIAAIDLATAAVAGHEAAALVTNPIAKHVLYGAGFKHPGHTEFLAELAGRHFPGNTYKSVMLLAADELRVVPLTVHVALATVPGLITVAGIIETAMIFDAALKQDYALAAPRIAIAGLNPHAGENGTMGSEDRDVIAPAIAELRRRGVDATGPHSADTMFHTQARARYDGAVAMYHDQALIPLKTLAFDRGVNITLGLPFVRTSPDHGTAFDIAGTGTASTASFVAALREAYRIAANRRTTAAAKTP
jgi:4-hydroxythreonine-4-phosphate dehydrogenase